jgi:hypothetical protein
MPDRIPCPRCTRVGLVRVERVITGSVVRELRYCGYCEFEWDILAPPKPAKAPIKPKAYRSKTER